jgi:Flp pilus assembly protein TadB
MYADAGPPLVVMAIGLVLWLAVTATVAGISIHTVGLILFLVGVVWLVFEFIRARSATRVDEPVAYREEPVVYRDRRL